MKRFGTALGVLCLLGFLVTPTTAEFDTNVEGSTQGTQNWGRSGYPRGQKTNVRRPHARYSGRSARPSRSIPPEIAVFLAKVKAQCGSLTVGRSYVPGARIAGTGRQSCHALGLAVDYTTLNPSCALRVAQGFRGGHSTDYARVRHFHVSICPQEMGRRFVHGGGRKLLRKIRARRAGR